MSRLPVAFTTSRVVLLDVRTSALIKGQAAPFTENVHFAHVYAATPPTDLHAALDLIRSLVPDRPGAHEIRYRLLRPPDGVTPPGGVSGVEPDTSAWPERFHRPFRIAQAPEEKIADSLHWMHTYLSRAAARGERRPEELFAAYASLLKCEDHRLARLVTPNVSIMLQRRVVRLLAPGAAAAEAEDTGARNVRALQVLRSVPLPEDPA